MNERLTQLRPYIRWIPLAILVIAVIVVLVADSLAAPETTAPGVQATASPQPSDTAFQTAPPAGTEASPTATITLGSGGMRTPIGGFSTQAVVTQGTPQPSVQAGSPSPTITFYVRTYSRTTPTRLASATPTRQIIYRSPTWTRVPTRTLTVTPTRTRTRTPTTTYTATLTFTASLTFTPTATFTATPTYTATPKPPHIAFSADQNADTFPDLLIMNVDGSNVTPVLTGTDADGFLLCDWSPDGEWLVYEAVVDGTRQLFRVHPDGSGAEPVAGQPAANNSQAAYSPDGQWLAFRSDNGTQADLYLLRVDGAEIFQLTNDAQDDRQPDWAPDGETLVFSRFSPEPAPGSYDLYTLDVSGLLFGPPNPPPPPLRRTFSLEEEAEPRWSPSGAWVVFSRKVLSGNWDIFALDSYWSLQRTMTTGAADDTQPAWTRDSKKVIFITTRKGGAEIFQMNADGSGQVEIVNGLTNAGEQRPNYQP